MTCRHNSGPRGRLQLKRRELDVRIPAELFPLAEFVRDEMEARKWDVPALASAMGVSIPRATELLNGRKPTRLDLWCIAGAFGTDVRTWINIQAFTERPNMAKRKAVTDSQLVEACLAYGRAYLEWSEKHGAWTESDAAARHVWWLCKEAVKERKAKT